VSYVVTAPSFEGPIDLLLHLVSTHERDVLEIPLAPLVDAFVAQLVADRASLTMDALSEFLLVAAILVELKSQRLLPGPDEVDDDEELGGWEERDLLLGRLLECQAYAAAADAFVALSEQAALSIPREAGLDEGFVVHAPDLLAGVAPEVLAQAYLRATAERPAPRVDLSHVTVDRVTVAEAVEELAHRLPGGGPTSFRELTRHLTTRIEVIVRFLALLELCKLGKVSLGQGHTFGDLEVNWIAEGRPLAGALIGSEEYGGGEFSPDEYDG
jgi:segregation and condensation protein A